MMFADIWNGPIQAGFAGLCVLMLWMQFWIIKKLFAQKERGDGMLKNDLGHVKKGLKELKETVDTLPCQIDGTHYASREKGG